MRCIGIPTTKCTGGILQQPPSHQLKQMPPTACSAPMQCSSAKGLALPVLPPPKALTCGTA